MTKTPSTMKKYSSIYFYPRVPGLDFNESDLQSVSMTEQHFKDECDVNLIVKQVESGQYVNPLSPPVAPPRFGDFANGDDFRSIQDKILYARNEFEKLPSEIRRKFDDNVEQLLDFVHDPSNGDECVKLGLLPHQQIDVPDGTPTTVPIEQALNNPPSEG